jgi:Deoxyribose-phosphate aldolase
MVVNLSKVLSEDWTYVADEIRAIVDLAHSQAVRVKVIFENCYLQDKHKIRLCEICGHAGADWVKTSTGYRPGGATLEDLRLMREHCPPHVQVKAAGGIRDLEALLGRTGHRRNPGRRKPNGRHPRQCRRRWGCLP